MHESQSRHKVSQYKDIVALQEWNNIGLPYVHSQSERRPLPSLTHKIQNGIVRRESKEGTKTTEVQEKHCHWLRGGGTWSRKSLGALDDVNTKDWKSSQHLACSTGTPPPWQMGCEEGARIDYTRTRWQCYPFLLVPGKEERRKKSLKAQWSLLYKGRSNSEIRSKGCSRTVIGKCLAKTQGPSVKPK